MKIRISPEAEQDLIEIFDFILADNPLAADKTLDVIYSEIHYLSEHPNLGRVGRVSGTRELVLSGAPFIVQPWYRNVTRGLRKEPQVLPVGLVASRRTVRAG